MKSRKGITLNTGRTHFKKGMTPWNKGLKGDKRLGGAPKGHSFGFTKGYTPWNKGKTGLFHHSKEEIKKITKRSKGKNCIFWRGGITPEHHRLRMTKDYTIWRTAVFIRDNYTCQDCGTRGRKGKRIKLNADHIKPFSTHPELRLAIDNGRTLCIECHKQTFTYGKSYSYLTKMAQFSD